MKHIIDDTITKPEVRWPAGYECSELRIVELLNVNLPHVKWLLNVKHIRTARTSRRGNRSATIEDVLAYKAKRDAECDKALTELAEIDACD